MRSLQSRRQLALFLCSCLIAAACSAPAGAEPSATASPPAPSEMPSAPESPSPTATSSPAGSSVGGGGRGDYDYGDESAASPTASAASAMEIKVASGAVGDYLTDSEGRTLYTFRPDDANVSTCEDACADAWPPLVVAVGATVEAADGVTGTLATFERADGSEQVSYQGAPLYYFARDTAPGDVNGHGAGDAWFVAAP